jgi:hypothetical protein
VQYASSRVRTRPSENTDIWPRDHTEGSSDWKDSQALCDRAGIGVYGSTAQDRMTS